MDSTKKIHLQGELQEDPTTKMTRTMRPFKRSATEEPMTAQSGLVLHGEFPRGLGFHRWLEQEMPKPGSKRGYAYVTACRDQEWVILGDTWWVGCRASLHRSMIMNRWMATMAGILLIGSVAAGAQASTDRVSAPYPLTHNRTIAQMREHLNHEEIAQHRLEERIVTLKSHHDRAGAIRAAQQLRSKTADIAGLKSELHDAMTNGKGYQSKTH